MPADPTPLIVSRFDVAMEPAMEDQVLTIGCIAEDGRPVALLLDEETRGKVARWLAPPAEPVRGPLYVESTPLMVTLDVTPLVENNVHDLLELIASDEFFDEFMTATNADPDEHDDGLPDRLLFEELKTRLVEQVATKVALTGVQAVQSGEQIRRLGMERAVPAQREAGAA